MVTITIDERPITVPEGSSLLDAATQAGIGIPTLCYLEGLNCVGSCRICLVDVEGQGMVASCNTAAQEGMVVHTNTMKVTNARRENLQEILNEHRTFCATCCRQDSCALRSLSARFDVADNNGKLPEKGDWDESFPLQRDSSKCISCMRCVSICEKIQHCNVWDFAGVGPNAKIIVRGGLPITEAGCSLCGQCITHCPTGALTARDDIPRVMKAILNPDVMTVVQVAPAVRAAWGEGIGISREEATPGRLASALRGLGFDKVFDTDFAADLTIMEEANEFLEFFSSDHKYPMFTSCCPGWVRFAKQHYPHMVNHLSSAKSPHQMLGAVVKNTLGIEAQEAGKELFVVSIMPCVAKKYECSVPELSTTPEGELTVQAQQDVDAVLTVREFDRLLSASWIDCDSLEETDFDSPLGLSTGAGTIFGRTGGVMEAALRSAAYFLTGQNPDFSMCDTTAASPETPWLTKELDIAGNKVRVAIASGLENAAALLDAIDSGAESFDFVEIMACPGGCVGGGGQPICFNTEQAKNRAAVLDRLDNTDSLRYSHENPDIKRLYDEWLEKPLSHRAHEWLHTDQETWQI